MEVKHLVEFGNNALYNGKNYTFANPDLTEQEKDFANYLFSEERTTVLGGESPTKVQPVDIKFFFKIDTEKKAEKPNGKPKESQK